MIPATGADCQTLERLAFIEKSKTYILELRCFDVMQTDFISSKISKSILFTITE